MSAEVYMPTPEDIQRVKPHKDKLKVSGDGIFATLQGEGVTTGAPSVFLRLQYCNLTCGKPEGWECDTGYTWDTDTSEFWKEPEDWSFSDAASKIEGAWESQFSGVEDKRLVITGGEPMIQQGKIVKLLDELPNWQIEIETNGTLMPVEELHNCQFNCSPKLSNSGNSLQRRYRPEVLRVINGLPNSQFKFVVSDVDDLEEVNFIVNDCNLDPNRVLIMPEGQTAEEVLSHEQIIKEAVEEKGWKTTFRSQLVWYGAKRRT